MNPPGLLVKDNSTVLSRALSLVPSIILHQLKDPRTTRGLWNATSGPVEDRFYATLLNVNIAGWADEINASINGDVTSITGVISQLYALCVETFGKWGGDLLSFDGSSFLVLFDTRVSKDISKEDSSNIPGSVLGEDARSEDSNGEEVRIEAVLAVQCGLDIVSKLSRHPSVKDWELVYRVVVGLGEVSLIHVGKGNSWSYVFSGGARDDVMRLEQVYREDSTDQFSVALSNSIYSQVGSLFSTEARNGYWVTKVALAANGIVEKAAPWKRSLQLSEQAKARVLAYLPRHFEEVYNNRAPVRSSFVIVMSFVSDFVAGSFSPLTKDDMNKVYLHIQQICDDYGAILTEFNLVSSTRAIAVLVSLPIVQRKSKKPFEIDPYNMIKVVLPRPPEISKTVRYRVAVTYDLLYLQGLQALASPADQASGRFVHVALGPAVDQAKLMANDTSEVSHNRDVMDELIASTKAVETIKSKLPADVKVQVPFIMTPSKSWWYYKEIAALPALLGSSAAAGAAAGGAGASASAGANGSAAGAAASGAVNPTQPAAGQNSGDSVRAGAALRPTSRDLAVPDANANANANANASANANAASGGSGAPGGGGGGGGGEQKQKEVEPEISERANRRFHCGNVYFHQTKRTAKYVVTPQNDDIGDDFLFWLVDYWDLEMPKMVISITGGAIPFNRAPYYLDPEKKFGLVTKDTAWDIFNKDKKEQRDVTPSDQALADLKRFESKLSQLFSRGIGKAAVKAKAWLISGGADKGVMQLAGAAVRDNEYRITAIGICSFNQLYQRSRFIQSEDYEGGAAKLKHVEIPIPNEKFKAMVEEERKALLEPNHTHFVMVNSGGSMSYGGEVRFRFQVEADLVSMVPGVLVIANGGPNSVNTVIESVRQARPIIVVKGTGRFADQLAHEWEKAQTKRREALERLKKQQVQRQLELKEKEQKRKLKQKQMEQEARDRERREREQQRVLKEELERRRRERMAKFKDNLAGKDPAAIERVDREKKRKEREKRLEEEELDLRAQLNKNAEVLSRPDEFEEDLGDEDEDPFAEDLEIGELRKNDVEEMDVQEQMYVAPEFIDTEDHLLAEIISEGNLHLFDLNSPDEPLSAMEEKIIKSLFKQPRPEDRNSQEDKDALNYAWRDYARFDHNARVAKNLSRSLTLVLIFFNLLATLFAVLQQQLRPSDGGAFSAEIPLRYCIIIIPLMTALVLSINNKLNPSTRWLALRAAAERIKAEIYKYRIRGDPYSGITGESRTLLMNKLLDEVQSQLQRTDVNQTALEFPHGYVFDVTSNEKDRFSLLMPDDYYKYRVLKEISYYRHRIPLLHKYLRVYQMIILFISGGSAILGTFKVELWVAFTSAVVAAVTTLMEYSQVSAKLLKYNNAVAELESIRSWWKALSPVEKASPIHTKNLIDTTESVIANEVSTWVQAQRALTETEEEKRKKEKEEAPEIKRIKNPQAYMKDRVQQIYNRRTGNTAFPLKEELYRPAAIAGSS